jgi:hypothetical protein
MRMRELVWSLRAYFFIIGLFFAAQGALTFLGEPSGPATVGSILSIAFALAYVYVGVRLNHLLAASPKQVIVVVLASAVPCGIGLIASLLASSISGAFWCAVQLLITWYLYVNVRRLSSESASVPQAS